MSSIPAQSLVRLGLSDAVSTIALLYRRYRHNSVNGRTVLTAVVRSETVVTVTST
jgi:hypothetical protein